MADRYWVGGSGTWDGTSTANWSATSGGTPGASAPTAADIAYIDGNSGASPTITVASTGTAGATIIDSPNATVILSANATLAGTTNGLTLTTGTLNLNDFTLTVGRFFSSGTGARTIAFGTNGLIITNNSTANALSFDLQTVTNLTITGTPRARITGNTSSVLPQNNATEATAINYTLNAFTIFSNSYAAFVGDMNINNWFGGGSAGVTVYGNFTAISGLAVFIVGSVDWTFSTSSTKTYSCSYYLRRITFNGTGTWNLGSALNCSNQIYLTSGTLTTNNYNVTGLGFISSNTNTRALNMGSSTFSLPINTNSTPAGWDLGTPTNMTLNAGTSTIYMNLSFNASFNGGGLTYSTLSIDSNNILTITGSNTFAVLRRNILSSNSFTINFQSGSTTTVSDFQIKGTTSGPTNFLITLNSTTPGSTFTLTSPSDTVSVDYLNIKDSVATGTAKWYAGNNSIDSGNNTGWIFTAPPSAGFLMFF